MNDPLTLSAGAQALLARLQSPTPTRYRLKRQTEEAYVFCAYDALLYTLLIGGAVSLEAHPPKGDEFTLGLTPEGPEHLNLWHSFAEQDVPLPKVTGMPSNRCPYLHLFKRREDAEGWHEGLPEALSNVIFILPLETVWQKARAQVECISSTTCAC